ncbi:hybrid sensory kinase in two-component regulatory system with RcsB and YojN [Citrobacter amalonaticus]|nr:hybrid sensory kinase in two-component regulatory system with RcsB and YojN [Citrobacter amalonaticus]
MIFCRRHIGIPLERVPGEWVYSVASPHELPALLARIYRIELDDEELSSRVTGSGKSGGHQ